MISALFRNDRGASTVEFGLLAALVSAACIIALEQVGLNLAEVFNTIADAMRV